MHEFLLSYKNTLLQSTLSISLTALIVFLRIPIFFLYAIHTYIHPDHLNNGVKAAIRRPDSSDSGPKPGSDLRKRPKSSRDSKSEFDESNAQIFRLKLDEGQIQSRLFSEEYRNLFTVSFVGIASLALHIYLDSDSAEKKPGVLEKGAFIPVLLGFAAVFKSLTLMVKLSLEKSASRRSEKQFGVGFGVLGLVLGLLITSLSSTPSILDFDFSSVDMYGSLFVAALMGLIAGLLLSPAKKIARSFWLGTDQIRCNLSMVTSGWFARLILYSNHSALTFASLLWIKPLTKLLVVDNETRSDTRLHGSIGFSASDFSRIRVWVMLASGVLQIVAVRFNLQMYLNEALLSWYQRLHASKVPDLEFSRAKVFLHNHYLCLVAIQFLVPPVLVLTFLGLHRIEGVEFGSFEFVCKLLPCSAFDKEVALFLAWWVCFVSALFSCATIAMFRSGHLYVS